MKFVRSVAGDWITPGELPYYMKLLGAEYPVIVKLFNGERTAVSLEKLAKIKDGIREAWFPTEGNWSLIAKHGMEHLEKMADQMLSHL